MITDEELIRIILDIFDHVKKNDQEKDFHNWFTGITYNPGKRELIAANMTYVSFFKSWNLRNKETAKSLKKYLLEKGFNKYKPELAIKTLQKRLIGASSYLYVYKTCN